MEKWLIIGMRQEKSKLGLQYFVVLQIKKFHEKEWNLSTLVNLNDHQSPNLEKILKMITLNHSRKNKTNIHMTKTT